MANCGMTQGDVSDLLDTEVDWAAGRIIRKRSKTADRENVPVVNYKLWPQTFKLLKKYRSGTERVLLTERGLPYIRTELKGGKPQQGGRLRLQLRPPEGPAEAAPQAGGVAARLAQGLRPADIVLPWPQPADGRGSQLRHPAAGTLRRGGAVAGP